MYGSGASCDGYWLYEHFAVQLEDCLDVIQCLYKDKYDYKINVDHSCGHDRQKENALKVENMNHDYGGVVKPSMYDTIMVDGCLGKFNLLKCDKDYKLVLGNVQSLVWKATDYGPYFMQDDKRKALANVYIHVLDLQVLLIVG
mmetsp:Transcript_19536/g.21850  ORF Transcript_19536/g.21850 Transcript_19536/m.21850 type:complete len:143 (-) Transcript_19536:600-1028(-)